MKLFRNKIIAIIGFFIIIIVIAIGAYWPKTFVYQYPNSSEIEYLNVFSSSVWLFRVDPECQKEITTGEPSPGFAVSYHFCNKRWWQKQIVESKIVNEDQTVYILKLEHSGEKGEDYRTKLVVGTQVYWDNQFATRFYYQPSRFIEALWRLVFAR
jgi:hypothetical protein